MNPKDWVVSALQLQTSLSTVPSFCASTLQWMQALEEAERAQAVSVLLSRVLAEAWSNQIPAATLTRFHERIERERLRSSVLDAEVENIAKEFEQSSVRALHFGASSFRGQLYSDSLLRPTREIDVLVFEASDSEALRKLGRLGYRVVGRTGSEGSTLHLYRFSGGPQLRVWRRLPGSLAGGYTDRVWAAATRSALQPLPLEAEALVLLEREVRSEGFQSPLVLNDFDRLNRAGFLSLESKISTLQEHGLQASAALVLRSLGMPSQAIESACGALRKRGLENVTDFGSWASAHSGGVAGKIRARYLLGDGIVDVLGALRGPDDSSS